MHRARYPRSLVGACLVRHLDRRASRVGPIARGELIGFALLIEKALSEAARKALAMESQIEKFFTEAHWRSYNRGKAEGEAEGKAEGEAKGKAEGEAKGKADALLMILRGRGLAITDEQRRQIAGCTELATLDRWLERALSVTSIDELLA